jgi:hypothetical protein
MDGYWLIGFFVVIFLAVLLYLFAVRSRDGRDVGIRVDFDGYKGRESNERYVNHHDSR